MDLPSNLEKTLIDQAKLARQRAYAPYSDFKVGAALLTEDEDIITGCNIENISFTPTVCAERTAIFKAISQGKSNFKAIVIVSSDSTTTPPCGVCRQVMSEFVDNGFQVILATIDGEVQRYDFADILPLRFIPTSKIGKQSVWDEFDSFLTRNQITSKNNLHSIKKVMENNENFNSKLMTIGKKYNFNDRDIENLKHIRNKIFKSASSQKGLDRLITDDERKSLKLFLDLIEIETQ